VTHSDVPVRLNAPTAMLDALPFDVLQLSNNHALDMDDDGTSSTKANVLAGGYRQIGVDEQLTVDVKGHQIAFLNFTWGVNRRDYMTKHELFIVPFGHIGQEIDLSSVATRIAAARDGGAEYVVLMLHWGFEFEHYPDPHFLKLARQMIALGADVIAAEHPHVVQPAEICWVNHPDRVPGVGTCSIRTADGKPRRAAVLYSMGNFSNDNFDRIESNVGIVAKVSLDGGEVTGMGWTPTYFQENPPRVEPLEAHLGDEVPSEEFARLKQHLGDGWRLPAP
jgi:poly-gamma-glutamate synthesis protein (capsule biosynthesis protein)